MARAKKEQTDEKAKKEQTDEKAAAEAAVILPESLILTVAELQALSPEDQDRFRQAGGTSIENPQPPQD